MPLRNNLRRRRRNPGTDIAASKFYDFHGRKPRSRTTMTLTFPEKKDNLVFLGEAKTIVYACDKLHGGGDGKFFEYEHKFSKGTRLYTDGLGKMLYIFGPKMRVQEPGIIG